MVTLTVELNKERDLPAVKVLLTNMGLKFSLEDDEDLEDLPKTAIEGIKAGLADFENGRVHSHQYVMEQINKKLNR